jgi:methylated-DNA-[protein]-cysteine S-methyltransferase
MSEKEYIAYISSPVGSIRIETDATSVISVHFNETEVEPQEVENPPLVMKQAMQQLNDYFRGTLTSFSLPLNPKGTPFQLQEWEHLKFVPFGETRTYADIARNLGNLKLTRAVGLANSKNPVAIIIPCHRIIGSGNKLTGYAGGLWRKKWLLQHELTVKPSPMSLF